MKTVNLPTNKAHIGSKNIVPGHALADQNFCLCLLGIMLIRNGGQPIAFSQADMDAIAGLIVLEGKNELGDFMIGLGYPDGGKHA